MNAKCQTLNMKNRRSWRHCRKARQESTYVEAMRGYTVTAYVGFYEPRFHLTHGA